MYRTEEMTMLDQAGLSKLLSAFEADKLSNKANQESENFKALFQLEYNIIYGIGRYLHEDHESGYREQRKRYGTLQEAWVHLFQEMTEKHKMITRDNGPSKTNDFKEWRDWVIREYLACLEKFVRRYRDAAEYYNGFAEGCLSFSNSHHTSEAISKYKWALESAEKLLDLDKIVEIKNMIQFLNTA